MVLSNRLWRRAFGGSPDAVGKTVMVEGIPRTVVGVADPRVNVPRGAELFVPLGELRGQQNTLNRGAHGGYSVLARLRNDTTIVAATAELNSIAAGLEQKYPETNTGRRVRAQALFENAASQYRLSLSILLGAVGCVLLIACANIAGLQLARALRGDPETAAIPLVILSALIQEKDQTAGMLAGADQYLTKPTKPQELVEAILQAIRLSEDERLRRLQALATQEDGTGE